MPLDRDTGISFPDEHQKIGRLISYINTQHGDEHGLLGKALLHLNSSAIAHQYGRFAEAQGKLLTAQSHVEAAMKHISDNTFQKFGTSDSFDTPEQKQEKDNQYSLAHDDAFMNRVLLKGAVNSYTEKLNAGQLRGRRG